MLKSISLFTALWLVVFLGASLTEVYGQSCTVKAIGVPCVGSPVELYLDCSFPCDEANFKLYDNSVYVTTSRVGGAPISYTFTTAGIHNMFVEYINSPCGGDFEGNNIEVLAGIPTPVVSGVSSVCPGGSVTLGIDNPVSGVTYTWTNGAVNTIGTGTSITIPTVYQTETFVANAKNAAGCVAWQGKQITVPTADASPQLVPTNYYHREIIRVTNGTGGGYYWQTSAGGQVAGSTNSASFDYTVYESAQFWLRRYISGCWLPAVGPLNVPVDYTPPAFQSSQTKEYGYNVVNYMNSDREHILKYATYYWVKDASANPEIIEPYNNGLNIVTDKKFEDGVYYIKGRDNGTQAWGATTTVTVQQSQENLSLNWIETRKYDGNTETVNGQVKPRVATEMRLYADDGGNKLQAQVRVLAKNKVITSQGMRDRYDRSVGQSHVAPILGNGYSYKANFMLGGQDFYDYRDFDLPADAGSLGNIHAPAVQRDDVPGTLGWYYSKNNEWETGVPVTKYPYSRSDFYEDGTSESRLTGGAGEAMRFGSGNEALSGTFPVHGELQDYLQKRQLALPGIVQNASLFRAGVQTVTRDPQGKYFITITDKSGRAVMKAKSATEANDVLEVSSTIVSTGDSTSTANFRRLTYFYILQDQVVTISGSQNFVVENIVTNVRKPLGQTFAGEGGKWPAGFYRVILRKNSGQVSISFVNRYRDISYDIYDDAGRLRTTITPNGLQALKDGVPYAKIDKRTFRYSFRGSLVESYEADGGRVQHKSRKDGKIRFSQNALQNKQDLANTADAGKFSYTGYDRLGRVIQSGEYIGNLSFSDIDTQVELVDQDTFDVEDKRDWVTTVYDDPDPQLYTKTGLDPTVYKQTFLYGAVSHRRNANIQMWYSYDEFGRVKWVAQRPAALKMVFVITYTYDFLGKILTTSSIAYDLLRNPRSQFHHFNDYDADGRLSTVYTSLSLAGPRQLRARYEYYLHGPLKRIELGDKLQGIDFLYNIQGWLTHINHPDASKDPGNDGAAGEHSQFKKDVFGLILNYYESDFPDMFKVSSTNPQQPSHELTDPLYGSVPEGIASLIQPAYMTAESVAQDVITPGEYSVTGPLFRQAMMHYVAQEESQGNKYEADPAGSLDFHSSVFNPAAVTASTRQDVYGALLVNDREFLVDFGDPTTPTLKAGWNNMTNGLTGAVSTPLVDIDGDASNIQIEIVKNASNGYGNGNFYNPDGMTVGTIYPDSASRDSFFAYGVGGKYKVKGLNPSKFYTLEIFGSRSSSTIPNRVGVYTINNQQKTLSAANNLDKTVSFHNIRPTTAGEILMDFGVASGSQFGYINVLTLTEKISSGIVKPASLASTLVNRQGRLTWVDNALNETGFYIDRRKSGDVVFERLDSVAANVQQYTDLTVSVGTSFEYRIQSFNATEDSEFSNTTLLDVPGVPDRRFLVDFGNPAFPTNLTGWNNMPSGLTGSILENLSDGQGTASTIDLEVVQDASATFAGDGIYYNTVGFNGSALGYQTTACQDSYFAHGNGGTYKLKGLDTQKLYTITIFGSRGQATKNDRTGVFTINGLRKALDAANNSTRTVTFHHIAPDANGEITIGFGVDKDSFLGYMNVLDLTEVTNPIVETPGTLTASAVTGGVSLSWADVAVNETGYRVERKMPEETLYRQIGELPAGATTFVDGTTLTGTTYEYRICAAYGAMNSAYSNKASITTVGNPPDRRYLVDFGSPSYPTNLPGWNNVTSPVAGYTLSNIIDSNGHSSSIAIQMVSIASNGYGNGNVYNTDAYDSAFLGYPASACRDSYFASGPGGTYKLKGLNPHRFYSITIFGSRISTTADRTGMYTINGKRYTLDAANNKTRTVTFYNLVPSAQGELELAFGVAPGSILGYLGILDIKESSAEVVISPSALTAVLEGRFAQLAWTDRSANETGFTIERRAAGTAVFEGVADVAANVTMYTDGLLASGVTYEYRVVSRLSAAASSYSNAVTVAVGGQLARRFLIDMGDPATSTPEQTGWNNMTGGATGSVLENMRDVLSAVSSIDLEVVKDAWNNYASGPAYNTNGYTGTVQVRDYLTSATRDSYFAYASGGVYKLTGLNPGYYYTVEIFGSRQAVAGDVTRIGSYIIDGEKQILNAANNSTTILTFRMVRPNKAGEIVLDFGIEAGSQFGYINVLEFTEHSMPELAMPVLEKSERLAGSAGVKLTWSDNTPYETAYQVYRSTSAAGIFSLLTTVAANVTTYTDATAAAGQIYYYRVRGTRSNGVTPYSNKLISDNTGEVPVLAAISNQVINVDGLKEVALVATPGGNLPLNRKNVVILGSSTAEGFGASPIGNSWAKLLTNALEGYDVGWNVINLAKYGYNSDSLIVSGDPERNITKALTYQPLLIVINLPSNDIADGITPAHFLENLTAIKQAAESAGTRVLITTTQPRNFSTLSQRQVLQTLANTIKSTFGAAAIDLYTPLVNTSDLTIATAYNVDGVHVNNAGHGVIYQRIRPAVESILNKAQLEFTVTNAPPFVRITTQGNGTAKLILEPRAGHVGTYSNVLISAMDRNGNYSDRIVTIQVVPGDPGPDPDLRLNPLFNGLISSAAWRTDAPLSGEPFKGMYLYEYDDNYQLLNANWGKPDFANDDFSLTGNRFRVTGMTYDPNGNIRTLRRYDLQAATANDFEYDYSYDDTDPAQRKYDNKLQSVSGYVNAYTYDELGRLTGEDRLSEDDQYVEYDVRGRVTAVYADAAKQTLKIKNIYDDRGLRLAKTVYSAGTPQEARTTWYVRSTSGALMGIYEQPGAVGEDSLAVTATEIPVYGEGIIGTFYPQEDSSMAYQIADNLGNIRAIIREEVKVYSATMEDNEQQSLSNPRVSEMQYFENLFKTAVSDSRMNHTAATPGVVDNPSKSAYLYWVDGTSNMEPEDKAVGPAIALRVGSGDKIALKTWVRYEEKVDYTNDLTVPILAQVLGTDLASTLARDGMALSDPAGTFEDVLAGFGASSEDGTLPRAYLNYIVFDEQWRGVAAHRIQVSSAAGFEPGEESVPFDHELLSDSLVSPVTGFVYIWVSNGSEATKVWFDDLTITHNARWVTEATDYGVWGDILRAQRVEEEPYRFGYQGKFAEKDAETGWNHFDLREYDAVIGRWTTMDPKKQFFSPYVGMGNNAVNTFDFDGGWADDPGKYFNEHGVEVGDDGGTDDNVYSTTDAIIEQNTENGMTDWAGVQGTAGTKNEGTYSDLANDERSFAFDADLRAIEEFFSSAAVTFSDFNIPGKSYFFALKVGPYKDYDLKHVPGGDYNEDLHPGLAIWNGLLLRPDDWGNIAFGVAARSFGFSLGYARFGAGMAQAADSYISIGPWGNPVIYKTRDVGGPMTFFDQERDYHMIGVGYNH